MLAYLFFVSGIGGEARVCRPLPLKCQLFCQSGVRSWMLKSLLDRYFVHFDSCRHSVNYQMLFLQVSVNLLRHAVIGDLRSEPRIVPLGGAGISMPKHR